MKFETEAELLKYTHNIIGKTFKEFDTEGKLNNGLQDKGILGKIIETGFYKYPNNNQAIADFEKLGIELKVTGYIQNKNGTISAKERLVLSKINFSEIINEEFDFSKLLFKNKKILIIWYEYDYTKHIRDFEIKSYQLYDMSNDELIIKNDYEIIKEKVLQGKAHTISEGDTSFLGACVKGINGDQKVAQPNSEILAKPRAFSLKNSYLTGILRNAEMSLEVDNQEYKTVEEYVYAQIKKYIGKTQLDIYEEITNEKYNIATIPKNIGKILSDKLIGTDEELPEKNSLFAKTTYKIKNIPVDKDYKPLERTPFRTISLSEFKETWDNSEWKIFFEEITIIALCYEGNSNVKNGYRTLKGIKKISFTSDEIDSFGKTYNMIKNAIENKDISMLPYPNSFTGQFLEIAPKGQKGANAYETFFENDKTKVCFMMNKEFIYKKLLESSSTDGEELKYEDSIDEEESIIQSNKAKITEYNIFQLYNYGVSRNFIEMLADKRIPPYNIYINGVKELKEIDIFDTKKISLCSAIKDMIEKNDTNRNIYELMYYGVSKQTCDILKEKKLSIEILRSLTVEELRENFDLGNVTTLKIKENIKKIDTLIMESNLNIDTKGILEEKIKECTKEGSISVFKLRHILINSDDYVIENFNKDYKSLLDSEKIKLGLYGVEYKFYMFEEYIKHKFAERTSDIIIERYKGNTLEKVAQVYNLTRERVRQICAKLNVNEIEEFLVEDKYKEIFEKYNWTKESLEEILGLETISFNYLNEKYIKGNTELNEILKDEYFSEEQKEKLKKINKTIVTSDGDTISNITEFLKKLMVKYASDEIEINELTKIYNEEIKKYPELQLNELSERNLEARISRYDCAIFGANHKVRYYDYNNLSEDLLEQLKELIIINDGFYSTEYLYRNNTQLMKESDIRNEYELHNILKYKIDDEENNVQFLRMPNFIVEYREKDDFILDKIREYSPITMTEFINILYEEYGHKKATMMSYVFTNFDKYILNGYLNIETNEYSNEELAPIKAVLNKEIYSFEELKSLISKLGIENISDILTNKNLFNLGYTLKGSYVVKNEYGTIYGYLDKKIAEEKILKIDEDLVKISAIYNALNYYKKNLKLFFLAENIYITENKMNELGIYSREIHELINSIRELYIDKDYFSLNNVLSDIDCSKYENLGLSNQFIEDIIFYLDDIKTLRINNNRLFSFNRNNINITNFMLDMVNKYSSISLDDLEREISKTYQINVPFDKLKGYLSGTEIFYSDILGKIYADKNDYYKEVYDEQ